jgi:hypothetical protein
VRLIPIYAELLQLIEHLQNTVSTQNELIASLLNENAEQENMINIMMKEHID